LYFHFAAISSLCLGRVEESEEIVRDRSLRRYDFWEKHLLQQLLWLSMAMT